LRRSSAKKPSRTAGSRQAGCKIAAEASRIIAGNLQAAEDAERLLKAAAGAERFAAKAEKAKPLATGGERAIGLVDKFTPELTDSVEAEALPHQATRRTEGVAFRSGRKGCAGRRTINSRLSPSITRVAR
jgi:hypothetical protein